MKNEKCMYKDEEMTWMYIATIIHWNGGANRRVPLTAEREEDRIEREEAHENDGAHSLRHVPSRSNLNCINIAMNTKKMT